MGSAGLTPNRTLDSRPRGVTEYDDWRCASIAVLCSQPPPERRRLLQHAEVVAADDRPEHFLRRLAAERRLSRIRVGQHAGQRAHTFAIRAVLRHRDGAEPGRRGDLLALDRLRDGDELVRMRRRQIAKEHAVQEVKMPVLTPMPRASVTTATAVNAAFLRNARRA